MKAPLPPVLLHITHSMERLRQTTPSAPRRSLIVLYVSLSVNLQHPHTLLDFMSPLGSLHGKEHLQQQVAHSALTAKVFKTKSPPTRA